MTPEYLTAFHQLMSIEGLDRTNNPNDHGGDTKFGISKRFHPEIDLDTLDIDGAKEFYWRKFWQPLRLGEIHSARIVFEILEQAVNFGDVPAVKHVQEALCRLGSKVALDGKIGPQTINAVNNYPAPAVLLLCVNGIQFRTYCQIVDGDPTQRGNFVGWLRRVTDIDNG